ncbi:MAG: hypothetical protein PHO37_02875 [Kiritimatiellae bacterium]|nr:hypothetical protein [Kiritimatiellia bacterium]
MKEVLLILKKTGLLKGWIINNSNNAQSSIAGDLVRAEFYFGDHSPGHSEKYCLRLTPMNDIDPRGTISMVNLNYGVCETKTNLLYRGEEYTLTLEHAGTTESGSPDYDYTLEVTVPQPRVIDDPDTIICENEDSNPFYAQGKQAYIRIGGLDLDVDLNGDGIVNNIDSEELTEADLGAFTAVSNRVAIALRSTDFVAWTGSAELVVPSGIEVYNVQSGGAPLSSLTFSSLPQTLYVTSSEPDEYTLKLVPQGLNSGDAVKVTVVKVELDIRETAQPQNRVGRDDPRVLDRVKNRILVWANSGANTITFDLIKPPNIMGPVWIQIEDLKGLNSGMPHFERLDVASTAFTYTVADDNDDPDLLVRYGADLDSDGTLSGFNETKGTYEVYGVTAEDYAESRNNYNWYYLPGSLYDLADQLHKRFANGTFGAGDFIPTSVSGSATLNTTRLTHYFGASLTDAGFISLGGRQYYAATVTFPIYHYIDNSDASELIRESAHTKDGLDALVASLSYATVAAEYTAASGGVTRSVKLSLDGRTFQFGPAGSIGLGGVSVNSAAPYSSAGSITLQVTLSGVTYNIGTDAIIDLTIHDVFDFDYFTTGWLAGFSDSSQSAAIIQNGFSKTGSTTNAGQIGLVEVEIDGSVIITGRTVTP